mgnify:FL=1
MTIHVTPIPKLTEFATPNLTLTTANAAGTASVKTTIRSDASVLTYDTSVPAAVSSASATGSASTAARRDHVHSDFNAVVTGTYTGDGTTSQAITAGIAGVQIKCVVVQARVTSTGGVINRGFEWTTDTIVDDITAGCSPNLWNTEEPEWQSNAIIAVGTNSFTVDDAGGDSHPNQNGYTYNYIVWA